MRSWYYADNGQSYGPFQDNDIRELIKSALVTPDTLVWNDWSGVAERGWVKAAETDLSVLFKETLIRSPKWDSAVLEYRLNQGLNLYPSGIWC